jgi:hypothetical protein
VRTGQLPGPYSNSHILTSDSHCRAQHHSSAHPARYFLLLKIETVFQNVCPPRLSRLAHRIAAGNAAVYNAGLSILQQLQSTTLTTCLHCLGCNLSCLSMEYVWIALGRRTACNGEDLG